MSETVTLREIQLKTLRRVARLAKSKGYVERSELRDFDMPYVDELIKLQLVENLAMRQYSLTVSGDDLLFSGSTVITKWVPIMVNVLREEASR